MEVKKYNPLLIKPTPKSKSKPKPTGSAHERSSMTKLEARGLSPENKKKLDIIYAKGCVKTSRLE